MNSPTAPISFDVSQIPTDFGTGNLPKLLITFDNLNQDFQIAKRKPLFPMKCESFFNITVIRGSIQLRVNLHEEEIHEGQMITMMPGCVFEGTTITEDLKFCGIIIDKEYMETMRKNVGIHLDLTHRFFNYSVHDLPAPVLDSYLQMYRMICKELNRKDYFYKKEVIQRYCEIMVLKNISLNNEIEEKPDISRPLNRKEQILHDFLTLLEENFRRERSITFYANQMCLTPKYMSTIIKEISGKHGMQWIDEYVALEAKALLRNSELSVKQVSDQLNFPSQSMFGRFFKKMTGYSPKQYKVL